MFRILALLPLFALACSGDAKEEEESTQDPVDASCDNPEYNPWLGTCVETYNADCFDPEGTCEGSFDMLGNTEMEWENGASISVVPDFTDPFNPGAITDLYASDGASCSQGVTQNQVNGCFSQTTYTRTGDGAVMVFCIFDDGAMDVTCPDGSTISVTAEENEGAQSCQYAGDAEPCTF